MTEYDLYNQSEIIRSNRKSCSLEIRPDGRLLLRVPTKMKKSDILQIIREKKTWILEHMEIVEKRKQTADQAGHLDQAQLQELADQALKVISPKVAFYAKQMGVTYGRITIRNQKTRWGSCSSQGNLNFNCLLMLAPDRVVDYVVVHELCHRIEMNHSKAFWALVEKTMPDYRESLQWLKEHGGELLQRMLS